MRHLMCNDICHRSQINQAGMLWVNQQGSFPVGDQSPVFHSPSRKVGDPNQVQLGQGERDAEQGFKSWQH